MGFNSILYLVIPCYNEEEILKDSAKILKEKLNFLIKKNKISKNSKILFVNDGSSDETWKIINDLSNLDEIFTGICLSKNAGHQNALLAGLTTARKYADITISLDADLQDDINAIDEMVEKYDEGFEIVYGVRKNREKDSFFKRKTAEMFYKVMNFLGANTIYNHADFRLMSKRAVSFLEKFEESNIFLRGMIPNIGLKHCCVYYVRQKRKAGVSKYPLNKMISFAINGITSSSTKLIHLIFIGGFFSLVLCFLMGIYCVVSLITKKTVLGWASLITSIWALGGMILISLGIIGEYVGKIYIETKRRPKYIISENLIEK